MLIYVGTYTGAASKGIYLTRLHADGSLSRPTLAAEITNPSSVAIHPTRRLVYAISEINQFQGKKAGSATAFSAGDDGILKKLSEVSTGGPGPCYIEVDPKDRFALVANFGGGSVAMLPIKPDGSLAEASAFVQHQGHGTDPKRQDRPHAHQFRVDPTGQFALASDLGLDRVKVYRINDEHLKPDESADGVAAPGAGPRHFDFSKDGNRLYLSNELNNTMTVFAGTAAELHSVQTISTLPADFTGKSSAAHVAVHPNGRFVYVSNRGDDSIAAFAINGTDGTAKLIGHTPAGGKTPRHFAISPDGRWMLVANQDSDKIAVLAIDPETGKLAPVGQTMDISKPVSVQFATWK